VDPRLAVAGGHGAGEGGRLVDGAAAVDRDGAAVDDYGLDPGEGVDGDYDDGRARRSPGRSAAAYVSRGLTFFQAPKSW
jgi:hypothetical protein